MSEIPRIMDEEEARKARLREETLRERAALLKRASMRKAAMDEDSDEEEAPPPPPPQQSRPSARGPATSKDEDDTMDEKTFEKLIDQKKRCPSFSRFECSFIAHGTQPRSIDSPLPSCGL